MYLIQRLDPGGWVTIASADTLALARELVQAYGKFTQTRIRCVTETQLEREKHETK